jgi:hypothetical protein
MRTARLVLGTLAVGSIVRVWAVASHLPPRVATHFDASGVPNGWMTPDGFVRFHVVIMAVLVVVFLGLPAVFGRVPRRFVNVPNRDYWLAAGRPETYLAHVAAGLAWMGVLTVGFVGVVEELVLRANAAPPQRLASSWLVTGLVAYVLALVALAVGWFRVPRPAR